MHRLLFVSIVSFVLVVSVASQSAADWPFYSKPEFRGRVIDAETKEPIEGAVVVVLYYKSHLVGGPGGPGVRVMDAREALTDKKGEFYLSSYSTLMLLSEGIPIRFIFYKPGYMSFEGAGLAGVGISLESYFATDVIGKVAEIKQGSFEQGNSITWKGPLGIMELRKPRTREEKSKSSYVFTDSLESKDLPLLYKAIDEAEKNLKKEGM